MQLDSWRAAATRVRLLADNDAPRAYEEAKHLEAMLPADAKPADRARALNLLARIETYLALTEPAAAHAQQAFDIAAANGDRVGQAESDLTVALNSINRGNIDAGLAATQHSVAILEGVDRPDLLAEAMLRSTAMYRRFDQIDDSVSVAVRALQMAQRANNPLALAYAHNGLAIVLDVSGRPIEAREHALAMREQARAAHSRLVEGFAISQLATLRVRSGDPRGAEQMTREAVAVYQEVGVPFATSYALFALADLLAHNGRQREALRYLDEILDIYRRYPNRISTWHALNGRSALYQSFGDVAKAEADAERAYELAKELGFAQYLSGSATRRAAIATAKGNFRRAYELTVEAGELTAQQAREKAGAHVMDLIKRYETAGRQRDFDALTRRSEQQAAQLHERELQQRWLWTVLIAVGLALAGAALFLFRLGQSERQLRLLNQQLQRSDNDIRALNSDLEYRVEALTKAQNLARQRLEFLAQMSHELRTPLNAVTGFAQLLQRDRTLSARQTRGLRIIDESGRHLLTLISDLLDLARIDAARVELYPGAIQLAACMEIVCDTIGVKAEDKGLVFVYQAGPELPGTISVDEKRLRQILLNLLSNAVKFTDSGRITLRVSATGVPLQPTPPLRSGTFARLRFEVEDEGIGMADDQMARLFQPFEQVAEVKRREGGAGLGLAISRQLIRLMGGDIEVRSQLGKGSVFAFEIEVPVLQQMADVSQAQRTPIGYLGERRRVLVVDDVLPNRAMLLEVLATLGFEVDEAVNGAQALEVASRYRPHLIIMDLTMPVMDGFEATRRLRNLPATEAVPIIATSASPTKEFEARSLEAGANAFVSKPVEESALLRAIADLLGLEWAFDEQAAKGMASMEADVVPPPPAEMQVLRELALAGNMRSIRDRADYVRTLDRRYAAFAAQLRALAEAYQSSAITNLIERYTNT